MHLTRSFTLGCMCALVVLCCGCRAAADTTLRIVHFNDVHARVEPAGKFQGVCPEEDLDAGKCYGGFAKVATIIKEKRAEGDDVLVLDAGDEFMGTIWNTVYKGEAAARILNSMKVDAMALGNHEFDYGPKILGEFLDQLNVPLICANIDTTNEASIRGKFLPAITLDVNGVSVGVVGYTTPEIPVISNSGDNVTFSDAAASMQPIIDALKAEGVQIIIGLGHIGFNEDVALASQLSSIDILVGGHSHTKPEEYPKIVKNLDGKNVAVVQAFWASRYVGYFEATFNDSGDLVSAAGDLIELGDDPENPENYVVDDPDMAELINEMKEKVDDFGNEVVGSTAVFLEGRRENMRRRETNLGDLVCDSMVWHMQSQSGFVEANGDVHLCLVNGGGIRNSIEIGDITVEDSLVAQPFGNVVSVLRLSAAHIYAALESGVRRVGELEGEFPQVAGIRFKYCSTMPVGEKVTSVMIFDGTEFVPISPDDGIAQYNFVTNNFLANGGDGYAVFEEAEVLLETGKPVEVAFNLYLMEFSPIRTEVDGRIEDLCD